LILSTRRQRNIDRRDDAIATTGIFGKVSRAF
jgi:hypothetical protein